MRFKFYNQLTLSERKQRAKDARAYLALSSQERGERSFREWLENRDAVR